MHTLHNLRRYKLLVIYFFLYFMLCCLVFPAVFTYSQISGGDYVSYWPENIISQKDHSFSAWDPTLNLGWDLSALLHFAPYNFIIGLVGQLFNNNPFILDRLLLWLPYFVISFSSIYLLYQKIFKTKHFFILSAVIFSFNTYILMAIGGGQIKGIGLAYAFAPTVLFYFIKTIDSIQNNEVINLKTSLVLGVIISIDLMLEPRIAFLTIIIVLLYFIYSLFFYQSHKVLLVTNLNKLFIMPSIVCFFLQTYWILPTFFQRSGIYQRLGTTYDLASLRFFSFATFENTISLLHPNWPENIFGKIYFMRPEFLLIALFAFMSLLFIQKNQEDSVTFLGKRIIVFFIFLALIGAFLAKGTNDPFGIVYTWLFLYVPGFKLFRDPTKWYLLVAISYAILIPYTFLCLTSFVSHLKLKNLSIDKPRFVIVVCGLLSLLLLISPVFFKTQYGTFHPHPFPTEYIALKNFLASDKTFSRILWLPTYERFGYLSEQHPKVLANNLFSTSSSLSTTEYLLKKNAQERLQDDAIKYVVVPSDPFHELYVTNREFDKKSYYQILSSLKKVQWLKPIQSFGDIKVYQVQGSMNHFWIASTHSSTVSPKVLFESPTEYKLFIPPLHKNANLIFSEAYNPNWQLSIGNAIISPRIFASSLNSFLLPESTQTEIVTINYLPQFWVNVGILVSSLTLLSVAVILKYR